VVRDLAFCVRKYLSTIRIYASVNNVVLQLHQKQSSTSRLANIVLCDDLIMSSTQIDGIHRRNNGTSKPPIEGIHPGSQDASGLLSFERAKPKFETDGRVALPQAIGASVVMISSVLPTLVSWGMTAGLIFGGCCSNVGRSRVTRCCQRGAHGGRG
jgi:hypothetical protein